MIIYIQIMKVQISIIIIKEILNYLQTWDSKMFRMSILQSRIYPKGIEETPNQEGIEFYRDVFKELRNITLNH